MSAPAFTESLLQSYPNTLSQFGVIAAKILPFSTAVPVIHHLFKGFYGCHLLETEVPAAVQASFTALSPFLKGEAYKGGLVPWMGMETLTITAVAVRCTLCCGVCAPAGCAVTHTGRTQRPSHSHHLAAPFVQTGLHSGLSPTG